MAEIDLKTLAPDTSLPATGFLFGADSQAAASPSVFTVQSVATTLLGSTTLSGATITADAPVLNMSQTWNNGATTFTGLKFNANTGSSASGSLLLDLQTNTGGAATSQFKVRKDGVTTVANNLDIVYEGTTRLSVWPSLSQALAFRSDNFIGWSSNTTVPGTADVILGRRAAANLRLGAADAAAPVAQTLSVQSGTAGASALSCSISGTTLTVGGAVTGTIAIGHAVTGTGVSAGTVITAGSGTTWTVNNSQTVSSTTMYFNSVGQNLTITGSQGSGPSAGGSIVFQVAPAGSAGTTAQNALSTALTIGGDRRLSFPDGTFIINDAPTGASNQIGIWAGGVFGLNRGGGNASQIVLYANGVSGLVLNGGTSGGAAPYLSFASPTAGTHDTFITRDAANTLALRNGANAQTFNVYNTFTDASNYERFRINWSSNIAYVGTEALGTGAGRSITFRSAYGLSLEATNGADLGFQTNGSARWTVNGATGHFLAAADNTYDIGASGTASRPRNVFVGNFVNSPSYRLADGSSNGLAFSAISGTKWQLGVSGTFTDGEIYSAGGTLSLSLSGTLIRVGGTTSSFPALKRVSANLQVIAADNAGSAGLIVGNQALATNATDGFLYVPTCAGTPTGTPTAQTGTVPIVVDTTNNKLYFYSGAAWRDAGP